MRGDGQPVRKFVLCGAFLTLPRYCLQAAATQGMAANSDAKDRASDAVHHWSLVCAYWRSPHLGIVTSLRDDIRLHRLREVVTVGGKWQPYILTHSVGQVLVSPQFVRQQSAEAESSDLCVPRQH